MEKNTSSSKGIIVPPNTPNDGLPDNWKPIDEPPNVAGSVVPGSAPPSAPDSPGKFYAASVPLSMQLTPDIMPTRFPGAIGGYRTMPVGPSGVAGNNAAVNSVVQNINSVSNQTTVNETGQVVALESNGLPNDDQTVLNLFGSGGTKVTNTLGGDVEIESQSLLNGVNAADYMIPVLKFNLAPTIAASSNLLTIDITQGNSFSATDAGSCIYLPGLGPNYTDLWTTIATYISASQVTLAAAVTNAPNTGLDENINFVAWGKNAGTPSVPGFPDCIPALTEAIEAANAIAGAVYVPTGMYCFNSPIDMFVLGPVVSRFYGDGGLTSATSFIAQNPAIATDHGFMAPSGLCESQFIGFSVAGACYPNPGPGGGRTVGAELGIWTQGAVRDIGCYNSSMTRGMHIRVSNSVAEQIVVNENAGSLFLELDGATASICTACAIFLEPESQADAYNPLALGGTLAAALAGVQERAEGFAAGIYYNSTICGPVTIDTCYVYGNVPPTTGIAMNKGLIINCAVGDATAGITTPYALGGDCDVISSCTVPVAGGFPRVPNVFNELINAFGGVNSASVALTAQTASVSATSIVAAPVATTVYELAYVLETTHAGTGGTVTLSFTWNNGAGQTFTTSTVALATLGAQVNGSIFVKAASGSIQYSTTVASASGSPQYSLDVRVLPRG